MKLYKPVIVKKEIDADHFYYVNDKFTPGVTTILGESLPMPYGLRRWIGDMGNEKAERIFEKAGERGTLMHDVCGDLMRGVEIKLHELFPKRLDQKCIVGFINWFNDYKPEFKEEDIERVVASVLGFAGTLDLKCLISKKSNIVDFKSSKSIHLKDKLQITGYQKADYEMTGVKSDRMIVHLNNTKNGYSVHGEKEMVIKKKPITIDDFMTVFAQYKMLNGGVIPEPDLTDVYPQVIKLFEK